MIIILKLCNDLIVFLFFKNLSALKMGLLLVKELEITVQMKVGSYLMNCWKVHPEETLEI